MKNFRTFNLAVNFYKQIQCQKLPSALGNQLERAAQSIALKLAEGRGRNRKDDQLRFLHIALGSLRESQAILVLANLQDSEANKTLDALGAHLYMLIKKAT